MREACDCARGVLSRVCYRVFTVPSACLHQYKYFDHRELAHCLLLCLAATHCTTLYHFAPHCTTLRHTAATQMISHSVFAVCCQSIWAPSVLA